jgi:hypothetical protein
VSDSENCVQVRVTEIVSEDGDRRRRRECVCVWERARSGTGSGVAIAVISKEEAVSASPADGSSGGQAFRGVGLLGKLARARRFAGSIVTRRTLRRLAR